jgi:metal-responsive CopG/Arc/MetJ family transcriptional regulator
MGGLEVEVRIMSEKEEKFRRLTVRLPKSLFVELTTLAATLEKTKEELVQEAVKDLVEKYKNLAR